MRCMRHGVSSEDGRGQKKKLKFIHHYLCENIPCEVVPNFTIPTSSNDDCSGTIESTHCTNPAYFISTQPLRISP
ncbi:hypothetical protein VTO42DRAFT_2994 [Malbranchea cinnamomea]